MELFGRYQDGRLADTRSATATLEGGGTAGTLVIADMATREVIARWPAAKLYALHSRKHELRISLAGGPVGARFVATGAENDRKARQALPALADRQRQEFGTQLRILGISSVALASVIAAYIYGIPLIAGRIAGMVPPAWEERLGESVVGQIESTFADSGFEVCDTNPQSVANTAIARFVDKALAEVETPFNVEVMVVDVEGVPNAFALPGGRVYYFADLIEAAENADEFAGVLAHEIGHVVHRHGMETMIATAGTGLLIGFVLGDMTGISVAGTVGAALIDTRFSRDAERQADAFAADVAQRLGFRAAELANLLERVAADDEYTRALALLSTHPLTAERRAALDALAAGQTPTAPAFSDAEWAAIRSMCSPSRSGPAAPRTSPATDPDYQQRKADEKLGAGSAEGASTPQ